MRISDWSSDVCSSDLEPLVGGDGNGDVGRAEAVDVIPVHLDIQLRHLHQRKRAGPDEIFVHAGPLSLNRRPHRKKPVRTYAADRKRAWLGKSVSVRVDFGGRRSIKKKNNMNHT